MFAYRQNSQKPGQALYAAFKESYPNVGPRSISAGQGSVPGTLQRSSLPSHASIDLSPIQRPYDDLVDNKEQEASPKVLIESRTLTPLPREPSSLAFSTFVNHQPVYYTVTSGDFNTFNNHQAADLHFSEIGINTPSPIPQSVRGLDSPRPPMHLQHQNPHMLHDHDIVHDPSRQQEHQQQFSLPQYHLQRQGSAFDVVDVHKHHAKPVEMEMAPPSPHFGAHQMIPGSVSLSHTPQREMLRFCTTLNAPTAMIKHINETTVTYLNKGQVYTLSVYDTTPPMPYPNASVQYRTCVQISFEHEQQRARPGFCWQLWQEGRGLKEAHERGGKLLAVEYVDPSQGGDVSLRESQVEIEKAALDGFAVIWYPNPTIDVPDCSILVRFNFLSTDFSRSKGVKGIPVRLCVKTELVSPQHSSTNEPEVCFSKVKLFRNHGAERKLSSDAIQVKKTIEKLKRQILQAEQGWGDSAKRKRSRSMSKPGSSNPGQVVEHKQTRSVDSNVEFGHSSIVDDLHMKLVSMQGMFSSTHPVSILSSRGVAQDDPDIHSIITSGGEILEGVSSKRSTTWESQTSISKFPASEAGIPNDSSISQPTSKRKSLEMLEASIQHGGEDGDEVFEVDVVTGAKLWPRSVKVPKLEGSTKEQPEILALGIDNSYHAPVEKPVKPAACFYLRQNGGANEYYSAVYLLQRTVQNLIDRISQKFQKDPARVTHVVHVNSKGLYVVVDEDVVRDIPEGQDMLVDFLPTHQDRAVKHEQTPSSEFTDGIIDPISTTIPGPLKMWLIY